MLLNKTRSTRDAFLRMVTLLFKEQIVLILIPELSRCRPLLLHPSIHHRHLPSDSPNVTSSSYFLDVHLSSARIFRVIDRLSVLVGAAIGKSDFKPNSSIAGQIDMWLLEIKRRSCSSSSNSDNKKGNDRSDVFLRPIIPDPSFTPEAQILSLICAV